MDLATLGRCYGTSNRRIVVSVTLSVETSGQSGMLALRRDGELIEECELEHARRRHAQTLVAEAKSLLQRNQTQATDIDLVAVSIGPGSFTGLRVGVVFAKTFAFATAAKIVAVDTLHALALAAPESVCHVSAVSDAQREQVFVGNYKRISGNQWQRNSDIVIQDNKDWIAQSAESESDSFAVTGPALEKIADEIAVGVNVLSVSHWHPRAAHVGIIGEQLAAANEFADAHALEPFYLRKSAAEEKRDLAMAERP
jgi:tRNA threonylcarbamoyladenosine biosynthesis protein TsaB